VVVLVLIMERKVLMVVLEAEAVVPAPTALEE
jgi:hypothetical protein